LDRIEVEVIFDVGAWISNTSSDYLHYFPSASVHAFEPFPESFKRYQVQHSLSNKVSAHQVAISDKNGTATFYSNKVETTNSLLSTANTNSKHDFYRDTVNEIEVDTKTLDQYCKEHSIERINILKMDTQGGELKALIGAAELLTEKKIDLIYCEVNFVEMYTNSPLYHDIAVYLENKGYSLHNLYGLNRNERGELAWGDAIFTPKSIS